ncbi:FUSC family protein [Streptomyces sp. SD15]
MAQRHPGRQCTASGGSPGVRRRRPCRTTGHRACPGRGGRPPRRSEQLTEGPAHCRGRPAQGHGRHGAQCAHTAARAPRRRRHTVAGAPCHRFPGPLVPGPGVGFRDAADRRERGPGGCRRVPWLAGSSTGSRARCRGRTAQLGPRAGRRPPAAQLGLAAQQSPGRCRPRHRGRPGRPDGCAALVLGAAGDLVGAAFERPQHRAERAARPGWHARGFAHRSGVLQLIGHHGDALWFLLPVAVLVAGTAPSVISFAAGQAAFTVTLVVMFNVGQDPDWHIVLLRIEDIALGCAVSLLVGLFFWPRGATAAVDRALAEAYRDSARYLAAAVEYAVGCCGGVHPPGGPPVAEGRDAAGAARRLDDAFRSYLAEHGSKPTPLADMTTLVTGIVGLRLAADAVLGLWQRAGEQALEADRGEARIVLLGASGRVTGWYRDLAATLSRGTAVPQPLPRNPTAEGHLVESLRRDLSDERGRATATAVRVIWTADHLDAARRLQPSLATAARPSASS